MAKKSSLLGDVLIEAKRFSQIDAVFRAFRKKEFKELLDRKKSERVNRALLELIEREEEPSFLLSETLDFVERVDREKILEHYTFTSFELWLNQHSGLSFEENYRIRSRIAGKWVDRNEYQILFPIGMGKVYRGTHFVTAHKSPDLDSTIASFWGWLDSFAARVGDGLHIWNLPGGPPPSQIEIEWIFRDVFGPGVFTHLPKTRTALSLTGNDLMSQSGLIRKTLGDSIAGIEHERDQNAVIVVDNDGFYLGDWRSLDVEAVRQVIILLSSCLRWFENSLHLHLISLFAKVKLRFSDIEPILKKLFHLKLSHCEPAQEFTGKQKKQVDDFARLVLRAEKGLDSTFEEFGLALEKLGEIRFVGLEKILTSMKEAKMFDRKGNLVENRPRIFTYLEKAIGALHEAIFRIRGRLERFDVALKTKNEVFEHHPTYVTVRSEVEEIRSKMSSYPYLTVAYPDRGMMYPVGVIAATDLRKSILGTVSLRDFCNRDEMTIPPYLDVISVIDHHKTSLNTFSPPIAIIADCQSSNTLVALRAFEINDRYSLGGQKLKGIDAQIQKLVKQKTPLAGRILERLFKKRTLAAISPSFFVHQKREFLEYLHFLYGILDDTDLLTKVSRMDVECVTELLNRMKSLTLGKEIEILTLDDLPKDSLFSKKAAMRILKNRDMYSLYRKVYDFREKEVEKNVLLCSEGKPSNIFADTKEQNGCCRVGQTKVFTSTISLFQKKASAIRKAWLKTAMEIHKEKREIDLHIHMISTIVSAREVYKGTQGKYKHKDEMWIWVPEEELAVEHLKRFLNAFQNSAGVKNHPFQVEFLGSNAEELSLIFKESFLEIPQKRTKGNLPIAVLRYKAGTINSRKAMVSPYLPTQE